MAAAQDGDAKAYEGLLQELLPEIRSLVRRRLPDEAAVEDVVQNTLLAIHRSRHTYRPERPFGPWLRAVTRNAFVDHVRARGRRSEREVSLEAVPEPAGEPAPAYEGSGLSPELERALAALPAAQREAVELIQLRGLSVAEAAVRAGVSIAALKVRAHRGYRALRASLSGGGDV
ncbi:MAG TPA: sigma-70 family RNA polymerase sigma factor [Myxococcota bacterium]|nr:sigma-70 family RNA polymerase sigma factor [Myxococcota bacterium]